MRLKVLSFTLVAMAAIASAASPASAPKADAPSTTGTASFYSTRYDGRTTAGAVVAALVSKLYDIAAHKKLLKTLHLFHSSTGFRVSQGVIPFQSGERAEGLIREGQECLPVFQLHGLQAVRIESESPEDGRSTWVVSTALVTVPARKPVLESEPRASQRFFERSYCLPLLSLR